MFITLGEVLNASDVEELSLTAEQLAFVDGKATAGWSAREVKQNRQASGGALLDSLRLRVETALRNNLTFQMAVRPKHFSPILFAKYSGGEAYGLHVDDAIMSGSRADVAFTVFLAPPDSYDGGALILDTAAGEEAIKLPAGSAFVYPATTLHRVEPVMGGERFVAVGWVRSYIRSAEQRELLFDLDRARRTIFARDGNSPEFNLLSKSTANLIRMWADD
jgi:PKHD-type hydroxylase